MKRRFAAVTVMLFIASAAVWADTLVLTNGRRIQGELIGVFAREIEFEERSGFNRRVIRVPRREIARIEFQDDEQPVPGNRNDRSDDTFTGVPRGLRERQVNVTARDQWTDSGVDVRAGQTIYIQASGETRWGPNRRDGAAGERNSPYNAGRPLPDRPAAALIGRIGQDDLLFVGDHPGPYRIRSSGRLYLGINDDFHQDNTGSLRVTISY
jgi:hypothetical protein